jgi:hypothetical protein
MENKTIKHELGKEQLELIQEMVGSIQFGTISIIVQDGKIVQIEKNEKYRIKG